jgi:hypothetical protein
MLDNTRQLVFKGGDMCKFAFFDTAVQSALQWNIIETAVHSKLQAIYKGAIDCSEHSSLQLSFSKALLLFSVLCGFWRILLMYFLLSLRQRLAAWLWLPQTCHQCDREFLRQLG